MVRVACVQLDGEDGDRAARTAGALAAIGEAAAAGARLLVLPELWPVGFFHPADWAAAAEPLDGPTITALAAAARDTGTWIHGGSIVERSARGLHNTGVLLDPSGTVTLAYRKMHLFGHRSPEADLLVAGDEAPTADTPFGRVGATTCFDLRFPELYRDLTARGTEVLIVASAWPAARLAHWSLLLRARAVENQAWVIACNAAGTDAGVPLAGHSAIVDPWGTVVAEAGPGPGVLLADLDPGRVGAIRAEYPFLAARRR